jgi:NADH dehydrogenase [ubiquinone] 1 alpha subcomplex assembly factor 5
VTTPLFDQLLLAMRRRRALREGADLFLHERALEDIVERLSLVRRRFRSALLIGWPESWWPETIRDLAETSRVIEPGGIAQLEPQSFDLCVAIGGLDTVDDLPRALLTVRFALEENSLFLGAIPGGDTLPRLREAMRAADEQMGAASPHVHPRIEPVGLSSLLGDTGFTMPVVDVDRVQASYESLAHLVRDLRKMGATNVLSSRSRRPLSRSAVEAAAQQFASSAEGGRTTETFELLHFAAWTPSAAPNG